MDKMHLLSTATLLKQVSEKAANEFNEKSEKLVSAENLESPKSMY